MSSEVELAMFDQSAAAIRLATNYELRGFVTNVTGVVIEATGPFVSIGSTVTMESGRSSVAAQVVGFKKDKILLMPYGEIQGIDQGAIVRATSDTAGALVSEAMLGRVIDGMGEPVDGKPLPVDGEMVDLYRTPPNPITRKRIHECFDVGVRAINSMLTVGAGQRIGIMAGSGVGKSTLLGMIAKHSQSDINVIALIGERGREVREFIERDLGEEGLKRSIVVVATGDQSPLLRIRAAFLATSIAEHFRDAGKKVVLMLDSVTRFAMAQREIGLAIGEPPSTRGYTPSVFSLLPKLLERAGTSSGEGSITGIYTVLVEGDDLNEPISDATRGILDGHIVLSRRLAGKGHFPAIEVLDSVSRVMSDIVPDEQIKMAAEVRDIIATYRDTEDLITIGAYKPGQNPKVDRAVQKIDAVNALLKQASKQKQTIAESWQAIKAVLATAEVAPKKR
jgi:flagellum-specific ATP synthase